jgi:tellurite resistance protein TehA-like permease
VGKDSFSYSGVFGGSTLQFPLYAVGDWSMSCGHFSHTFEFTFKHYASFRITKHEHSYQKMTSVWLLPVVTLIVASSFGGELAQALHAHSVTCALTTIAVAIFILSIGLALALMILTIYLTRLILHGFPQGLSIVSSFLPLGPCGQAGFSVLVIGQFMKEKLPVSGSSSPFLGSAQAGEVVFAVCVCISFILWAFATMWLVYALLGIQHILRKTPITFELAFWGMIFPNVSRGTLISI